MWWCLFDRSTGIYEGHSHWDRTPHNDTTHIELQLPVIPTANDRWDGDMGIRSATAQELADHNDTIKDESATGNLNTPINKVLRDLYWDIEERLRAAGQVSNLTDIAATGTKAAYTGALKDRVKALL